MDSTEFSTEVVVIVVVPCFHLHYMNIYCNQRVDKGYQFRCGLSLPRFHNEWVAGVGGVACFMLHRIHVNDDTYLQLMMCVTSWWRLEQLFVRLSFLPYSHFLLLLDLPPWNFWCLLLVACCLRQWCARSLIAYAVVGAFIAAIMRHQLFLCDLEDFFSFLIQPPSVARISSVAVFNPLLRSYKKSIKY